MIKKTIKKHIMQQQTASQCEVRCNCLYILYRHITKHLIYTLHNLIARVEWFYFNRQSACLYVGNMLNMLCILLRNYSRFQ